MSVGPSEGVAVGDLLGDELGVSVGACEGDAVGNCIESIQFTINGCSISHQNWHLFKSAFIRVYLWCYFL